MGDANIKKILQGKAKEKHDIKSDIILLRMLSF
jgi:hypothetical protein